MQAQKQAERRGWNPNWKQELGRSINDVMKPILKCEDRAWYPPLHGSPEQDVSIFFEKWLKDENPLDTWVPVSHPHLKWTPEMMIQDFELWMEEIQRRIFALNRAAAGS